MSLLRSLTKIGRPDNSRRRLSSVDSAEVQEQISSLLHDQDDSRLRNLSLAMAQGILDELWEVLYISPRDTSLGDEHEMGLLGYKIAVHHEVLPAALLLKGVKPKKTTDYTKGGFAVVHEGTYDHLKVALKVLLPTKTLQSTSLKGQKTFFRETLLWSTLKHENILPFLGVSDSAFPGQRCMVMPWMTKGCVRDYIQLQRDRGLMKGDDYVAAIDKWVYEIICGLEYLHGKGLVHGDLHGGNVLIDEAECVRLADFGLSLTIEAIGFSYGSSHGGGAVFFTAPELIDSEEFGLGTRRPTYSSDIYAFACTCIELYSGKLPFRDIKPDADGQWVSIRVCREERPTRPSLLDGGTISDQMWALTQWCWTHDPSLRPSASRVADEMEMMPLLSLAANNEVWPMSETEVKQALSDISQTSQRIGYEWRSSDRVSMHILTALQRTVLTDWDDLIHVSQLERVDAQIAIDWIWEKLLESKASQSTTDSHSYILQDIAETLISAHEVVPTALFMGGVKLLGERSVTPEFPSVYAGKLQVGGQEIRVAVRRPTTYHEKFPPFVLARDCIIRMDLKHRHVLPLLGVARGLFPDSQTMCAIYPWMGNGPIVNYIRKLRTNGKLRGAAFSVAVNKWQHQIAIGLEYMHEKGFTIGASSGNIVFVDRNEDVCITPYPIHSNNTSRWSAPEELGSAEMINYYARDVYTFGCICLELHTAKPPFSDLTYLEARKQVMDKQIPPRPRLPDGGEIADELWSLICNCWSHEPAERPTMTEVVKTLEGLVSGESAAAVHLVKTEERQEAENHEASGGRDE